MATPQPARLDVAAHHERIRALEWNIGGVFLGKQRQVRHILLGFVSGLHVLIEDVPGVDAVIVPYGSGALCTGIRF